MSPCYECEYWIPLFLDEMVKLDEFEANKHCEECSAVSPPIDPRVNEMHQAITRSKQRKGVKDVGG